MQKVSNHSIVAGVDNFLGATVEPFDLIRAARHGHYAPKGDPAKADCILVDGFGFELDQYGRPAPGRSNRDIADFVAAAEAEYGLDVPVIGPTEPVRSLRQRHYRRGRTHAPQWQPGERHHVRQVMKRAVKLMQRWRCHRPMLVVSAFEVARADGVLRRLGYEAILPPGLEVIRFNPKSEQPWTRSAEAWAAKEWKVDLLFWALRWYKKPA